MVAEFIREFAKVGREMKIIREIREDIDSESLLQGLILNDIRSKAATMVLEGKLDEDFYKKVFCGATAGNPYWKVNRDYIMNYEKY